MELLSKSVVPVPRIHRSQASTHRAMNMHVVHGVGLKHGSGLSLKAGGAARGGSGGQS
jgi:hypothetical protein